MTRRKLVLNVCAPLVQVVVNGLALFFLYRHMLRHLGPELFGVWALVLSWCSTVGIANLGMTGAITKFVAQHLAHDDRAYTTELISSAVTSLATFLGVALVLSWPLLSFIVTNLLEEDPALVTAATDILPYGMLSLWINSLAVLVQSAIDGHQRVDIRSLVSAAGSVSYLVLAMFLVRSHGLLGLAQAQLASSAATLALGWFLLRRLRPELPWMPLSWTSRAFRELVSYSLNFQLISFTYLLLEPATKSLMAAFGFLASISYFEMANKLTMYARSLVISSHQALVPTIAHMDQLDKTFNVRLYRISLDFYLYLCSLTIPIFVALTPIIASVWIGRFQPEFVLFASLMAIGWAATVVASPAYFSNLGTGQLKWNLLGHLAIGVLNVALGAAFTLSMGAPGTVLGFSVALLVGSLVMIAGYHKDNPATWPLGSWGPLLRTLGCSTIGAGLALALSALLWDRVPLPLTLVISLGTYASVVFVPAWHHPVRLQVARVVLQRTSSA